MCFNEVPHPPRYTRTHITPLIATHPPTKTQNHTITNPKQVNEAGGIKKLLFNYAMARKLYFLRQGYNQDKVGRQ